MARIKLNGATRPVTALFAELDVAREFGRRPSEVRAWSRAERRAAAYYLLLRNHYRSEVERQTGGLGTPRTPASL